MSRNKGRGLLLKESMKTNLVFGILLLFLFSLGSCQKRRARNTLEGKWNVIGVQGAFIDQCSLDGEIVDARDTLLGELHFDRKEVSRAYVLMQGDPSCYLEAQRNDTKSWEVLDHERIVTAAHTYEIRIGDESWTVIFGENRIGEAARNQDVAYLAQLGGVGSALYIELERVN